MVVRNNLRTKLRQFMTSKPGWVTAPYPCSFLFSHAAVWLYEVWTWVDPWHRVLLHVPKIRKILPTLPIKTATLYIHFCRYHRPLEAGYISKDVQKYVYFNFTRTTTLFKKMQMCFIQLLVSILCVSNNRFKRQKREAAFRKSFQAFLISQKQILKINMHPVYDTSVRSSHRKSRRSERPTGKCFLGKHEQSVPIVRLIQNSETHWAKCSFVSLQQAVYIATTGP